MSDDMITQRIAKLEAQIAKLNIVTGADVPDALVVPPPPDNGMRWIIEGFWKGAPHYFAITAEGPSVWSGDKNMAMGFASMEDAERMCVHFRSNRIGGTLAPVHHQMNVRA